MLHLRPVHFVGLSAVVTIVNICISRLSSSSVSHLPTKLVLSNISRPIPVSQHSKHCLDTRSEAIYDEIKCIAEHSDAPCTFPLLADYHGHFAESTSWEKITEGYPKAVMSADICKVPPVTSAPQRLHDFIKKRNITSIVIR